MKSRGITAANQAFFREDDGAALSERKEGREEGAFLSPSEAQLARSPSRPFNVANSPEGVEGGCNVKWRWRRRRIMNSTLVGYCLLLLLLLRLLQVSPKAHFTAAAARRLGDDVLQRRV